MLPALIASGIAALVFSLMVLLLGPRTVQRDHLRSRMDELSIDVRRAEFLRDEELSKPFAERVLRPLVRKLTALLSLILPLQSLSPSGNEKQRNLLMQAGWAVSVEEYLGIQIIAMLCTGALGVVLAIFSRESLINTIFYFLGGIFAAYTLLRFACTSAATRRKKAMEEQLPDMLDLLSVSVAAGLGFERAMLHIINTMEGPLIDEFTVTYREMTMGRSRKDALTLLGERCGVEDLSAVTSALVQAGQMGIPMRNILQTQSAAIRRARRARVQEKAAKVSTKILLPMIAFIFPVLFIVLLGPSLITIVEQFS